MYEDLEKMFNVAILKDDLIEELTAAHNQPIVSASPPFAPGDEPDNAYEHDKLTVSTKNTVNKFKEQHSQQLFTMKVTIPHTTKIVTSARRTSRPEAKPPVPKAKPPAPEGRPPAPEAHGSSSMIISEFSHLITVIVAAFFIG